MKPVLMINIECTKCEMESSFDFETCNETEQCPWCGNELYTGVSGVEEE